MISARLRDSTKSDAEFFLSVEEWSTSLGQLSKFKQCKCIDVGVDCNLQLPGDVENVAGESDLETRI